MSLYDYINIRRRYTRSVNLERDLEVADSVKGYVITPKVQSILERYMDAVLTPNSVRAWTITGVYGTGKSALAHYLAALSSNKDEEITKNAIQILKSTDGPSLKNISKFPEKGFIKAVATAQREPIAKTVIKALKIGADNYWSGVRGVKPKALTLLDELYDNVLANKVIESGQVVQAIKELSSVSKSGLLIIIDELGKNLEYTTQKQEMGDLYLLQQIAELPSGQNAPKVFFMGLLHQSFYEYSHGLASTERNEWAKIQGRFEDIAFSESSERIIHLIGNALEHNYDINKKQEVTLWAKSWQSELKPLITSKSLLPTIQKLYPLHPIAALVLPLLCNKFSQNDRTLFSFLSSDEPHSFKSFLKRSSFEDGIPTMKVHHLYDYFIDTASMALSTRYQYQRWVEVHGRISEANHLSETALNLLKTIGILNLVSNTGAVKASRQIVELAMSDNPDSINPNTLSKEVDKLIDSGFVSWRKQFDELRIWEGSDFDIEKELSEEMGKISSPVSGLLSELSPMRPVVARRHSYRTGTIRYFESVYYSEIPEDITCNSEDIDGLLIFLLNDHLSHKNRVKETTDGKPIVIIHSKNFSGLQLACKELVALSKIRDNSREIRTDGVARRELSQRIFQAEKIFSNALTNAFDLSNDDVQCIIEGKRKHLQSMAELNSELSNLCDVCYKHSPVLWNELINRRELTSQGAKARRELIEAILNNSDKELLAIVGYGPEFSMYESVLLQTGIHINNGKRWTISKATRDSGIRQLWDVVESFCLSATKEPIALNELYEILQKPPYGIKQGIIPVILLAVLQYHKDYLSIYAEGSYVPILGPEHFELLVKRPELFSVRYFEISGLKKRLFEELSEIFLSSKVSSREEVRNATLLGIINPLVKFVKRLPRYSQQTKYVSNEAQAVRKALSDATDPELLLFRDLPQACGAPFLDTHSSADSSAVTSFKKKLIQALQELQLSYEEVLEKGKELLGNAFSTSSNITELRSYISAVAGRVNTKTQIIELNLKRFINVCIDSKPVDKAWLESLLMVIGDKPVESWTDADVTSLEIKIGEVVRRFKNIEAIIELSPIGKKEIEARKITITHQDGTEFNEVLWLEEKEKDMVAAQASEIIKDNFHNNDKINKALISAIIEELLSPDEESKKQISIKRKRNAKEG